MSDRRFVLVAAPLFGRKVSVVGPLYNRRLAELALEIVRARRPRRWVILELEAPPELPGRSDPNG